MLKQPSLEEHRSSTKCLHHPYFQGTVRRGFCHVLGRDLTRSLWTEKSELRPT